MLVVLFLFKIYLKLIYFFIKLFTRNRRRILILSRQRNELNINFKLILDEINNYNTDKTNEIIDIKVSCHKINDDINKILRNENKENFFFKVLKNILGVFKQFYLFHKQMYYIATSKVVIIDGYNILISVLKHKKNTKIIQIWHSLGAIKMFGYQTLDKEKGISTDIAKLLNMHKNYDFIITASEEMNKYFKEAFQVEQELLHTIGLPQIDYMLDPNINKQKRKELLELYPELSKKKNIIYLPTFRTDNNYKFKEIIAKFDFEKNNLIFLLHPKIDCNIIDDRVFNIKEEEFPYIDAIRIADYIITDYSASAMDALILDKTVFFYLYDLEDYENDNGLNINFLEEFPKYSFKEIEPILEVIKNDNYNMEEFFKLKKKYFKNLDLNNTSRLIELLKNLLK